MSKTTVRLGQNDLARFMPMYVIVGVDGKIRDVGPLLRKVLKGTRFKGRDFMSLFEFHRPQGFGEFDRIETLLNAKVLVNTRCNRLRKMACVFAPLPNDDGFLVNFNLGIGLEEIVDEKHLVATDFAPTDVSIDLLYMVEMQKAVLGAAQGLNHQLNGAKIEAEEMAITDPLTGLGNRRALLRFVRRLLSRDLSKKFAVILMDLDHFKAVNDNFGHAAGDYVLKTVANRLRSETRPLDMVARLGGDEFVVVLPNFGNVKTLESFFDRIIQKISEPVQFNQDTCEIGISLGAIVTNGDPFDSIDQILSVSDTALYESKNQGRGRFTIVSH
ncbi:GGDEF domain-containing protein [Amylibacter ulvae]|uniref:GGDEF domain-containing protein n=1 Tax=Paramylibacter ulvae TaxID=1651968 RepID=A0ABQ3D3C7_9RHOB|nr:GGDEF domain-containing protein [Amylibacter ulvae]GHA54525.1 GGDEF domain-containing protein [Amylibacter ulvae]